MHTWKIYDYSRTKTAAVLIYSFYFRSCATTSPMRIAIIHSVPPAFSLNFVLFPVFETAFVKRISVIRFATCLI